MHDKTFSLVRNCLQANRKQGSIASINTRSAPSQSRSPSKVLLHFVIHVFTCLLFGMAFSNLSAVPYSLGTLPLSYVCADAQSTTQPLDNITDSSMSNRKRVNVVTFGYLRMAGVDNPSTLAAYYAAVEQANRNNLLPGVRFQLNVTTVHCGSEEVCRDLVAMLTEQLTNGTLLNWSPLVSPQLYMETANSVTKFLMSTPGLTALFKPNHLMAPALIDYAREIGGLPIIDPTTVRGQDFSQSASGEDSAMVESILQYVANINNADSDQVMAEFREAQKAAAAAKTIVDIKYPTLKTPTDQHVIHFRQYIRGSISHVFNFMQQSYACVHAGILYEPFSEMTLHIPYVRMLFVLGGYPLPPSIDVTSASAEELAAFLTADTRRECFVALTTHSTFRSMITKLVATRTFNPNSVKFFGTSLVASDSFSLDPLVLSQLNVTITQDGDGEREISIDEAAYAFISTHFLQWHPPYDSASTVGGVADLKAAFGHFLDAVDVLVPSGSNGTSSDLNDLVGPTYSGLASYSSTPLTRAFDTSLETIPQKITDSTYEAYLTMVFVMQSARAVAARSGLGVDLVDDETGATTTAPTTSTAPTTTHPPSATILPPPKFVTLPIPWSALVAAFYEESRTIGGYPFVRLVETCPPPPMDQLCHCNTAARVSYVYRVLSEGYIFPPPPTSVPGEGYSPALYTGVPWIVNDELVAGQRFVATLEFPTSCEYEVGSWAYPITTLITYPIDMFLSNDDLENLYKLIIVAVVTTDGAYRNNYNTPMPRRPSRFVAVAVESGEDPEQKLAQTTDIYRAFVNFGSLMSNNTSFFDNTERAASRALTLFPSLSTIEVEDPPLVPHSEWLWEVVNLSPVFADYVHSLANYYANTAGHIYDPQPIDGGGKVFVSEVYSSLHAIATSRREAELIALSLATFGVDYTADDVVVSEDPVVWRARVLGWLPIEGDKRKPFILLASAHNEGNCLRAAYAAAVLASTVELTVAPAALVTRSFRSLGVVDTVNGTDVATAGVLAVATSESTVLSLLESLHGQSAPLYSETTSLDNVTNATSVIIKQASVEVVFGSQMREWWTPQKQATVASGTPASEFYRTLMPSYGSYHPLFWLSMIAVDFTLQLSERAQNNFATTAATMLYDQASFAVDEGTFGPFYNATCSDDVIARKDVSRECQCTKGVRTIYVHSGHSYFRRVLSTRTRRFSHTMTTCGVLYRPYVPPPSAARGEVNALSTAAIAGIVVGSTAFVLALIAAFVVFNCYFSRNNSAAPKDSSVPFAIVFTDIQSSTSLWARAPIAMSEAVEQHHAIMRKVLRGNGGYEVKTVGDSFMIAFKECDGAVAFALDVQTLFNEAMWSNEIDATYLELEIEAGDGEDGTSEVQTVDTTSLKKDTYDSYANPTNKHGTSIVTTFKNSPPLGSISVSSIANKSNDGVGVGNQALKPLQQHLNVGVSPRPAVSLVRTASNISGLRGSSRVASSATAVAPNVWHGVRVRIGVHFGMGEIRKDPVTLGYDYYGTVVNTAARVEGVGHGGQVLVTEDAFCALSDGFLRDHKANAIALGPQPLRGLDDPIKLHQLVPDALSARKFPPLRLHIQKETEDSSLPSNNETGSHAQTSGSAPLSYAPEAVAARICDGRQYKGIVTAQELVDNFNVMKTTFGPTTQKYKAGVVQKLGECWGFENASKDVKHEHTRITLFMHVIARATKAIKDMQRRNVRQQEAIATHLQYAYGSAVGDEILQRHHHAGAAASLNLRNNSTSNYNETFVTAFNESANNTKCSPRQQKHANGQPCMSTSLRSAGMSYQQAQQASGSLGKYDTGDANASGHPAATSFEFIASGTTSLSNTTSVGRVLYPFPVPSSATTPRIARIFGTDPLGTECNTTGKHATKDHANNSDCVLESKNMAIARDDDSGIVEETTTKSGKGSDVRGTHPKEASEYAGGYNNSAHSSANSGVLLPHMQVPFDDVNLMNKHVNSSNERLEGGPKILDKSSSPRKVLGSSASTSEADVCRLGTALRANDSEEPAQNTGTCIVQSQSISPSSHQTVTSTGRDAFSSAGVSPSVAPAPLPPNYVQGSHQEGN